MTFYSRDPTSNRHTSLPNISPTHHPLSFLYFHYFHFFALSCVVIVDVLLTATTLHVQCVIGFRKEIANKQALSHTCNTGHPIRQI